MSELMKLRHDHAKLADLFSQLGEMIDRQSPPPQLELFNLRRELVSTLLAHLKLEDWRATIWEIHPITGITVLPASAVATAPASGVPAPEHRGPRAVLRHAVSGAGRE